MAKLIAGQTRQRWRTASRAAQITIMSMIAGDGLGFATCATRSGHMTGTTDYTQDAEYLALLEAIRTTPADDAPRLIIADWLEEHGEDERAEFIRVQIGLANHIKEINEVRSKHGDYYHMPDRYREDLERKIELLWGTYPSKNDVRSAIIGCLPKFGDDFKLVLPDHMDGSDCKAVVHRGFISEIRLSCREFCGYRCEVCNGEGTTHNDMHYSPDTCSRCNGRKVFPGVARELFERHPITRVVLTDRKCYDGNVWFQEGRFMAGQHPQSDIPKVLLDKMAEAKGWDVSSYIWYDTEAAALAALSNAAVAYGRQLAGLPPLPH